VADGRDGDATPTPTVVEDRRWAVVVAGAFGGCSGVRREGNRTPPERLRNTFGRFASSSPAPARRTRERRRGKRRTMVSTAGFRGEPASAQAVS
jgi:hypothetical protein